MKHKQTSSLVEALLCNVNVGFEGLLGASQYLSLPLPVLRIISCGSAHPVLFGFCSSDFTVIVKHLNLINQPNNHKLWEVWDSRRSSVEILQRVSHCKKKLMSWFQFHKSLNNFIFLHTESKWTTAESRHPSNYCYTINFFMLLSGGLGFQIVEVHI